MEKAKKKQIKKVIFWILAAVLVALLAFMPLMAGSGAKDSGPKASILSAAAQSRDITTGIHSGGKLENTDSLDVKIPAGVKITEFLAENGDYVAEGQPLAEVDRVSVMSAITAVQETMEHLLEEMNGVKDEKVSEKITARTGGRVKIVYAQEGEQVSDVMLRDGALAVLSLDGMMAVDVPCQTALATGDSVTVRLSDGTEIGGRVESNLGGILAVAMKDKGYAVGEAVTVSDEHGEIGQGELYIHNAWKATAYAGTISSVKVRAEDTVSSGKTLFTLTDTEYTAKRNTLAMRHREYEDLMLELFQMYQSTVIPAPCDGVVSGVDKDSAHLLSDSGENWSLTLLANAPNGDDETVYTNVAGIVTAIEGGVWSVSLNPAPFPVEDYLDLSSVPRDPAAMTEPMGFMPTVSIFKSENEVWSAVPAESIQVGDILLFAGNGEKPVWCVLVGHSEGEPDPEEPKDPTFPTVPDIPNIPNFPNFPKFPNFSGNFGGMGGQKPEEFEFFDLEGDTLMTVSSGEFMTLTVTVDEKEISKLHVGQTAQVQVDALRGEIFPATVTLVGTNGSNNGGSSKFSVELTLPRQENMLTGMSARATVPLSTARCEVTVPVEALVQQGAKTLVYTAFDEKTGELTAPVEVTTGVSDGSYAEILSGLNDGDSFYYAYYDTLELSAAAKNEFGLPAR